MLWLLDDVMVAATPTGLVKVTIPETGRSRVSVPAFHVPSAIFRPPVKMTWDPLPEKFKVPAPVFVRVRVPFSEMKLLPSVRVFPASTWRVPLVWSWKLILLAVTDAGAFGPMRMSGPEFAGSMLTP